MLGYTLAGISAMLWGLIYTIDQGVLKKYAPVVLMFFCSATTLTINSLLIKKHQIVEIFQDKQSLFLVIFTAILGWIAGKLTLHAIQHIGAANSSIMEITYPMFICLFCWLFYRESLDLKFIIGAIFVTIGTVIIITR